MPENFMTLLFLGLGLLVTIVYIVRLLRNKFAPVTIVKAVVVNKQKVETVSKYSAAGKHTKYAVTFLAEGKRLSFYVSEFSYGGYRKNESGTLTYKGDKLIDFS